MTSGKLKKIKICPAEKYARWIKKLADSHGVDPSKIVAEIVRKGIRWHGYTLEEITAAAHPPKIPSEVNFVADSRFLEAWEAFKVRLGKAAGRKIGDTAAGRLLIVHAWKGATEAAAPNKQGKLF